MTKIIVSIINAYQKTNLKAHSSCVFLPTCSQYTKEAILKYGSVSGIIRGFIRICRCHPWQKNRYDPIA
jgi:uncharacterized protein